MGSLSLAKLSVSRVADSPSTISLAVKSLTSIINVFCNISVHSIMPYENQNELPVINKSFMVYLNFSKFQFQ